LGVIIFIIQNQGWDMGFSRGFPWEFPGKIPGKSPEVEICGENRGKYFKALI